MEVIFAHRKEEISSKFKEIVEKILGIPDSARHDPMKELRHIATYTLKEVNARYNLTSSVKMKNKTGGKFLLKDDVKLSDIKRTRTDTLAGRYSPLNNTENRILRRTNSVIMKLDGKRYRATVGGLDRAANITLAVIILSVGTKLTKGHILDLAISPMKVNMPKEMLKEKYALHEIFMNA